MASLPQVVVALGYAKVQSKHSLEQRAQGIRVSLANLVVWHLQSTASRHESTPLTGRLTSPRRLTIVQALSTFSRRCFARLFRAIGPTTPSLRRLCAIDHLPLAANPASLRLLIEVSTCCPARQPELGVWH